MPDKPDNPLTFWQELKRRKVFRVIAMYAATAFILLEVVDIVAPSLGLPAWTLNFVIVLLCIGFPIAVIISWIFDVTPEGIKKTEPAKIVIQKETPLKPAKRKLGVSDLIIAVLIVVVGILAYPKIFNKDKFEDIKDADGRISIAVMPFENHTGDTTLNWFQRGISSLISNGLSSSSELTVRDDHTMYEVMENMDQVFTAGLSPSQAKKVAKKVQAESYITGSYQGREGKYWILANLVETETGDIIWPIKIEGDLKSSEYLDLADSLCNEIKNFLEIKVLEQEADYDFREAYPNSAEAYRYYIEGMNLILTKDYLPAVESLKKALEIDSTFTFASFFTAYSYSFSFPQQNKQANIWIQKAYITKEKLPLKYQYWLELWYACSISKNLPDITRYCNLLEESGIESRLLWFDLATTYWSFLRQYDKAINAFEKAQEISLERGGLWEYEDFYHRYGQALHDAGKHDKEKEIFDLGLRLFPNNLNKREVYWNLSLCALSRADTMEANEYLEKYLTAKRKLGETRDNIEYWLGQVYSQAGMMIKAEEHLRNACELNPQKVNYIFSLARVLIEGDINVNEGLVLIEKVFDLYPNSAFALYIKGMGYFKLGQYQESLQLLSRAELNEPSFHLNSLIHLQIQEVELAIADQNLSDTNLR